MDKHTFRPGDRVRFIDDPEDLHGTVREPDAEDLSYAERSPAVRRLIEQGYVLVHLDGDEPQDAGWIDPGEMQLA
jgi:hypothetical protein